MYLQTHEVCGIQQMENTMIAKESDNRLRVAVVEDNAPTCDMLSETLERFGHIPLIFNDGWTFLEALTGNYRTTEPDPFDIVLLDILLPGSISGIEVLNYLTLTRPKLPLVIVSALSSSDLTNIHEQFPKVKIVQKPFHLDNLRTAIEV